MLVLAHLLVSHALAQSVQTRGEVACAPTAPVASIPDQTAVVGQRERVEEIPLLVFNGEPNFVQDYVGHDLDLVIASLPGAELRSNTLSGESLSSATVYIDGVRFEVGGRMGAR